MEYTDRVDGFQIRDVTYIGLPPKDTPPSYDIVKWVQTDPHEVMCFETGKDGKLHGEKKVSAEYCFSVGQLVWNKKEDSFKFESVLMRWLEEKPSEAVVQMILDFAEKKGKELYEWEDF